MARMTRMIPQVADRMTPAPRVVAPHVTVGKARELMLRGHIRHLPVVEEGKLVGIVSDGDLKMASALPGIDIDELSLEHVMTRKPYTVRADTPLNAAARVMAERRLGSAVVLEGKNIAGILTTTDALAALVDVLEGKQTRSDFERIADAPARPRTRQPTREARR